MFSTASAPWKREKEEEEEAEREREKGEEAERKRVEREHISLEMTMCGDECMLTCIRLLGMLCTDEGLDKKVPYLKRRLSIMGNVK